jgi:large subunit ribosomal protein L23
MGLLDRFKPKHEKLEPKKPRHVVKKDADEATKAFQAVPAADRSGAIIEPEKAKVSKDEAVKASAKKADRPDDVVTQASRTLIRPIITEKSSRLGVLRQYVFAVRRSANKIDVRRAIEATYGVRPIRVQTMNVRGKVVRYGRSTGQTRAWKKAVITLPVGKTIDVTEA